MLKQDSDVVCVQELKAHVADLEAPIFQPPGYHAYYHCAEKKGYSGVGIYTKHKPVNVITGLGWPDADAEGRYVEVDLGKLCIASIYLPSGTSGPERQAIKFGFLEQYAKHLHFLRKLGKEYVICGDWNIAHRQIDLKNWRGNQKNSGFLPEERAWMDELFGTLQFVDAFRQINQDADQYTWWSNRGQAYAKNVGWRIDYQIITPGLLNTVQSAAIYKDQRFSDHAPLIMQYDIEL
jgi:exodeoxyribonuclease-3